MESRGNVDLFDRDVLWRQNGTDNLPLWDFYFFSRIIQKVKDLSKSIALQLDLPTPSLISLVFQDVFGRSKCANVRTPLHRRMQAPAS
jgi:hypothetical protein